MTYAQSAPGKGFLKVTGILFVVFAGISIIALLALLGSEMADPGLILIDLMLVGFTLVMGILGIKHCDSPDKAQLLKGLGIASIVIRVLVLFWSGDFFSFFVGVGLPLLYITGANRNICAA